MASKGGRNGGRGGGGSSRSSSPPPPPPPPGQYSGNNRRRNRRYSAPEKSGYSSQRPFGGGSKVTLLLCVFRGSSTGWQTLPLTFDRYRTNDEELWQTIRDAFRNELQGLWRRLLLFKRLKHIEPIEFNRSGVPRRTDSKDDPNSHEFMHCYHHPRDLRTGHEWVDWFARYQKNPDKSYGLEFIEGLWAEKLAAVAISLLIAIIVVSIVWCVKGGQLQTVFTVMGFVLSGVAAIIALVALYYQVTLPG